MQETLRLLVHLKEIMVVQEELLMHQVVAEEVLAL